MTPGSPDGCGSMSAVLRVVSDKFELADKSCSEAGGRTLAKENLDSIVLACDIIDATASAIAAKDIGAGTDSELDKAQVLATCGLVQDCGTICLLVLGQIKQTRAGTLKNCNELRRGRGRGLGKDVGVKQRYVSGVEDRAGIYTNS
jgi:hypothetical protein